ncbi:MAG: hypothetical protein GY866_24800, partial [Proteobacteria bacterium]|nr:hypothetical protein [Pseudomonadota bacterium]
MPQLLFHINRCIGCGACVEAGRQVLWKRCDNC